ncbi:MAG: hypothetical protein J3R72DRAFT_451498 [Linnemannia gamsii]|nr:MAG: hypothetical protein J3R72DRAFT_451498 [Linnemannia gamsii]
MNPYSNSSIPPLPFLPPHDSDPLIMDDVNDDHQQQDLHDQSQAQQDLQVQPEQPEQPEQQERPEQQEQQEQSEQSEQEDQPEQQPKQKRAKIDGRKRPLLPLPPLYKIQLHLRKGEPLERRRLTSGLPDPEPYDHIQGQDSFAILLGRIAARVAQFPELFWPEDGSPYIKPAESVPQKYYQLLTPDNYEAHMAKAWRMEAKRLQDQSVIVLNLFVYLKDRNPPPDAAVAAAVTTVKRRGRKPAAAVKEAPAVDSPVATLVSMQAAPPPGAAVAGAPGRPPHSRPPPEHGSPYRPIRPPPPHLHGPRRPPPPGHGPPGRRPRPGVRPPGMDGRKVRGSPADQATHSILTPDEAVVAAINSSVVSEAPLTSSAAGSSNSSSSLSTMTGATSMTPILSPIPGSITPLSPTATRTQAPRAASARHRLSAIPNTHLPPPPSPPPVTSSVSVDPPIIDQDQDRDMHDDNDNDNHFDDLMQDDFDHGIQDSLPPTQTYSIHPTTPPPTSSSSPASVSPSSSAVPSIHTYSTQPHHLGLPQPQAHSSHSHLPPSDTQQQQLAQAAVNEGDFRTVNFKINGVVVPMLVDVMSLRAAIFS